MLLSKMWAQNLMPPFIREGLAGIQQWNWYSVGYDNINKILSFSQKMMHAVGEPCSVLGSRLSKYVDKLCFSKSKGQRWEEEMKFSGTAPGYTFNAYVSTNYSNVLKEVVTKKGYQTILTIYDQSIDIASSAIDDMRSSLEIPVVQIPVIGGEEAKSVQSFADISNKIGPNHIAAKSIMVVIGGGTVCNMAGFIASVWKGMDLLLVPSTYTAMCDVAVGSLQMINVGKIKNAMRNTYDPVAMIIDPRLMRTLPIQERRNGFIETIKHALCQDKILFEEIEHNNAAEMFSCDDYLLNIALRTAALKSELLSRGPDSASTEAILNYGHTVAHAIEAVTDYSIPHGQAVALGILAELMVINGKGSTIYSRVERLLSTLGYIIRIDLAAHMGSVIDSLIAMRGEENVLVPVVQEVGRMGNAFKQVFVKVKVSDLKTALGCLMVGT